MTTSKAPAKPRAPRKASAEAKPSTKPAIKAAAKSSTEPAKASAKPRSSRVVKEKAAVKPIATQAPANIAAVAQRIPIGHCHGRPEKCPDFGIHAGQYPPRHACIERFSDL